MDTKPLLREASHTFKELGKLESGMLCRPSFVAVPPTANLANLIKRQTDLLSQSENHPLTIESVLGYLQSQKHSKKLVASFHTNMLKNRISQIRPINCLQFTSEMQDLKLF